jgi:uncharacterized phage-associated protein
MEQPRSEKFSKWAEDFEARSKAPVDKDHPKWLLSVSRQYRRLAAKKEKALEHREEQRKRKSERH